MKKIISAIKGIFEIFEILFNFIQSMIENMLMLIKYLTQAVNIALSFISTLPPWLLVFAQITLAVCVAYKLLGRESGGNK